MHAITAGSKEKAKQVVDHLLKNNDFGYTAPPDPRVSLLPQDASRQLVLAKLMVAERVAAAIAMLKGPPTGYEQHAVALRKERPNIKETEIGALWAALGASEKAEHKQRAESGFVAGQSWRGCEQNRRAYQLALVLVAPQLGTPGVLREAAVAVGVSWDKTSAFAKAARVRAEIDRGERVMWQPDARQQRKDALSDATRALMGSFWTSECPAMPGASDFARKRIAPKEWERHQIHLQWSKTRDLLQLFNTTNRMHISYAPFLEEKPYWIRRGRQGTCMCGRCENTRHGQVACSSNIRASLNWLMGLVTSRYWCLQQQGAAASRT